jgi:hypothetical protein
MATTTVVHACDVFNQALPAGQPAMTDAAFATTCRGCGKQLTLAACEVEQAVETTYKCPQCHATMLIIGAVNANGKPWPGRGFRIQDFVIRNDTDLFVAGSSGVLHIERSPHALAPESDAP